jgi:multidrug efflux pump subunit AcrA (membrane-fusion protein)
MQIKGLPLATSGPAKLIFMSVRPLQASHLCFNVDGILGDTVLGANGQPAAALGASVTAFDFDKFYRTLESFPTTGGDKSRLQYDAAALLDYAKPYALATLRAEGRKLALQKALNTRQNAFYAKYGSRQAGIVEKATEYYSPGPGYPTSKPNRLANLSKLADSQWNLLSNAYNNSKDIRTGVYKSGVSKLGSTGKSSDLSAQTALSNPSAGIPPIPKDGDSWETLVSAGQNSGGAMFIQEAGTSSGTATTTNDDFSYRVPYIEAQAQSERAQISLIDQQFNQFMASQNLPNLGQVFTNELNSIDADVCRLQVAYLDTILMSPIAGVVTGVYKNPGDFVGAGEPVIRVEDNSTVLLVARLVFDGVVELGDTVTIQTARFERPLTPGLVGTVVSVRGQSADDLWEVIIQYTNSEAGYFALPLGYHFDYDDTTVVLSRPG